MIQKLIPGGADAGGKAPPKGKGTPAAGDESKPIEGEAWLDLTPLMYPGSTET